MRSPFGGGFTTAVSGTERFPPSHGAGAAAVTAPLLPVPFLTYDTQPKRKPMLIHFSHFLG
jgi:hypothetical protein